MKFYIRFFSNTKLMKHNDFSRHYDFLFELIQYAEEYGYYGISVPERHFHPVGGLFPSPSVFFASVSRITKKLKLQPGSIIIPLHSPVHIAEEWAMIDQLSKGRVELAFASGGSINDFIFKPNHYEARHQFMWEGLQTIQNCWNSNEEGFQIYPKLYQSKLPIYVTASTSNETCYEVGKRGFHLLTNIPNNSFDILKERIESYQLGLSHEGYSKLDMEISVSLHTFIVEDLYEVEVAAKEAFFYFKDLYIASKATFESEREKQLAQKMFFNKYCPDYSLLGTVDTCKRLVDKLESLGVTQISAVIDFGITEKLLMKSLDNLTKLMKNYLY